MIYNIVLSKSASKELHDLPNQAVSRIIISIMSLADNPRPHGTKKLKGTQNTWRIRVGDYRVVYSVDDIVRVVDIRKIGHRKDIYE